MSDASRVPTEHLMSPQPKLTKASTVQLERFLASPAKVKVPPSQDNGGAASAGRHDGVSLSDSDPRLASGMPRNSDDHNHDTNTARRRPRRLFVPPSFQNGYPSSSQRSLPAQINRSRILAAISTSDKSNNTNNSGNNFTLLIGATGCGKSTQLPQLLLTNNSNDLDLDPSDQTIIIVAQPRRLAAISLAQRVSQELQTKLGEEIGYIIRGENRTSSATVCTFVTYGVLLKMLLDSAKSSAASGTSGKSAVVLPGVTHLLLDEVHERSSDFDLILLFLKQYNLTGGSNSNFSITLMSATVDPTSFQSYLPSLKVVSVEGRSYPVSRFYLEDAVRDTNYVEQRADRAGGTRRAQQRSHTPLTDDASSRTDTERQISELAVAIASAGDSHPERAATLAARQDKLIALAQAQSSRGVGASTARILGAISLVETQSQFRLDNAAVARSLRSMDYDTIPNKLIGKLVERHCYDDGDGDVLIFLPGVREIDDLLFHLEGTAIGNQIFVLLHANLQPREQLAAFDPPPPGKTKIILATDIAEASITIPTVTLVIDVGLSRCVRLDPVTSLPHLTTVLASQSSLKQRAGRAGRVREGKCYHLIISPLLSELEMEPVPEMLTIPLDTVSLRARVALEAANTGEAATSNGTTEEILSGCLSPPPSAPCQLADDQLLSSGAICASSEGMVLTRHGRILASTPLSLSHASALVGSHRFGCGVFDDMALLLSALNSTNSRTNKWAAFDAKVKKSKTSDHIALLGQVRSNTMVRKEANRLKYLLVSVMGPPSNNDTTLVAASTTPEMSTATTHLLLVCLLCSSSQLGTFNNTSIAYPTKARMHIIRPHRSSVCSAAKNTHGYAFFGSVIKLPAGPVATDVSIVSPAAAAMFGSHFDTSGDGHVLDLLKRFGRRVKDVFLGTEDFSLEICLLLDNVLEELVPPWDGLPDGWRYDEESKLFRTIESGIHQHKKPKQSAKAALLERERAKGSLERADKLLGGKKGRVRGEGPALITATKSNFIKSKSDVINDDCIKKMTLAMMKQAEEDEKNEIRQNKGASGGVARMLADLNLTEKYASAFEVAGVDDTALDDILLMNQGNENEKAEGQKGIEELIKVCGLMGGSGVKVRKYLEGGLKGRVGNPKLGEIKKPRNSSATPASKAVITKPKSKQKKQDLSDLEASLGGGSLKSKGRRGKKK